MALGWRLFLIVPMAGEVAICIDPQIGVRMSPLPIFVIPMLYVVGLALFGPQATILGEFGWLVARRTKLPERCSLSTLVLAATAAGGVFGAGYQIATAQILHRLFPELFLQPKWHGVWPAAYAAGGAVGGLLVAYYAVKEFGLEPHVDDSRAGETLRSGAAGAGV
jgi:hypothetical protein